MNITVKGSLPIGFDYEGQRIKDFTARPAIVKDSIEAIEEFGADCSQARLRIGIAARQITFDGLPAGEQGSERIFNLCDRDYGAISDAIEDVEKKLVAQSTP